MKKNDKTLIILGILIFCMVITWFVAGGSYGDSGVFTLSNITRAGIFDFFLIIFYSIYYNITTIFYFILIGGSYGVLSKTKSYRKLVDKTVYMIRGREKLFFLLTTLLTGIFVSLSSNALVVFAFVPFIITVFLNCGQDRITALSAAIGGILIGIMGNTFGTYGVSNMMENLNLAYTKGIGYKIALFIIAYVLYNLFAMLHMNKKHKELNETEYNPFNTEELDEKEVKRSRKIKLWPTILFGVLLIIVLILGYIDWDKSFGLEIFKKIEEGFEGITIKGIPILYNLAGSTSAFGEWNDLIGAGSILTITTFIIALFNKTKLNDFIDNFNEGIKKILKTVIIISLSYTVFVVLMWYGWPYTLVNAIIGNGKFNVFTLLLAGIIIAFFAVDKDYIGYTLGSYLATVFGDNLLATAIIMNSASAIIIAIAPTSMILLAGLTLLDIPYKKWFGYIWKYTLAITIAVIVIMEIMCYM